MLNYVSMNTLLLIIFLVVTSLATLWTIKVKSDLNRITHLKRRISDLKEEAYHIRNTMYTTKMSTQDKLIYESALIEVSSLLNKAEKELETLTKFE